MVVIPARMRRLNRRALFDRLQRLGRASRAELAKSLAMSQPTAGKIVDDLLGLGLVEEVREVPSGAMRVDGASSRVGRPGRLLQPAQSKPRFLGVELGVSETRVTGLGAAAPDQDVWSVSFPTPGRSGDWVEALQRAAPKIPAADRWGVLVSVPGIVDEAAGRVMFSPNLHWTEGADLRAMLSAVWGVPVLLVQEERALALGHLACDTTGEDFLLVDFGDGVGAAAVVCGRLYESPLPISGELGHTPVLGNRRRCGCGAEGCVETLVSRKGLRQSLAEARPGVAPGWEALQAQVRGEDVPDWLETALDAVAAAIAGALNVVGVRRVILTGDLTELGAVVVARLAQGIIRGSLWARFGRVEVLTAPRRRAAGLVSAGVERLVLAAGRDRDCGGARRRGGGPDSASVLSKENL